LSVNAQCYRFFRLVSHKIAKAGIFCIRLNRLNLLKFA